MTKATRELGICIAELRQHLSYDPETGVVVWIKLLPKAQKGEVGKEAGFQNKESGYRQLSFRSKTIKTHRVAWALHHGEWPNGEVDHINNNRADNRLVNLRLATRRQNAVNQPGRGSNTGVKGVYWHRNRYLVMARDQTGYNTYLGRYKTIEEAKLVYDDFIVRTRGEFAKTD